MGVQKQFWYYVFSEPNGNPSFSRVATAIVLCFALTWVSVIIKWSHELPDFAGLVGFIGVLYGINRASTTLRSAGVNGVQGVK
jgi:hypothetical protein